MKQREKPYEEIYDLLAIRVLVNTVPDCYHALGVIHDGWTPVQERIKDYIAQPKSNGYQSLHTTVFGPGRQLYEVQIRTRDMHRTADFGIAAHWRYKEDAKSDELDRHLSWFRQVLELQMDAKTPDEFLEFLKLDLYQDEIFVFTPTGDVIQLPKGATPLDFAFAVHTEIGLHCAGAQRERPHRAALAGAAKLGDGRDHHVDDGEADARLARARPHGPRAPQDPPGPQARSADAPPRSSGRRCSIARSSAGSSTKPDDDRARRRGAASSSLTDATHLLASIGQGDVNVTLALKHLYPDVERRASRRSRTSSSDSSIACADVEGRSHPGRRRADGALRAVLPARARRSGRRLRDARARREHPSRGLSRTCCSLAHEPERRLEIDWQEAQGERFLVRLALEGNDRRGLYADVAAAVSSTGTDIKSMDLRSTDGRTNGSMLVEVENLAHLEKIIRATRRVKGVTDVARRERLTTDT